MQSDSESMFTDILEEVKGFITTPVEAFQKARDDSLESAFGYYIVLLALYAAIIAAGIAIVGATLSGMSGQALGLFGAALPLIVFVGLIISGIISVFVGGAWLHLFVMLLGGQKGYSQTVKSLLYGWTPHFLLGWIPFIGLLGSLWSLGLVIIGVRELHQISTERSIAAVLIAILLPLIVIVVLGAAFFMIWSSRVTPF